MLHIIIVIKALPHTSITNDVFWNLLRIISLPLQNVMLHSLRTKKKTRKQLHFLYTSRFCHIPNLE